MTEDHRKKLKEYRRDESKQPMRDDDSGDCDLCNEWSSKLIDGVCPPCRTQWKIK